jgi:hypothetical protein
MIKEEDPNHPTSTAICRVGREKLDLYRQYCPDIDILGLNGYLDMATLPQRLDHYGWDGPFVITEFGADGPWEVEKSPWNAPLEPNSGQKARAFEWIYRNVVQSNPNCLGSYAFVWCDGQEGLLPWFNMQLPGRILLEPATALGEIWTGAPRGNRPPVISPRNIVLGHDTILSERNWYEFAPGTELTCTVDATDPDGDPIDIRWRLCVEASFDPYFGRTVAQATGNGAILAVPDEAETVCYRLSVVVTDDHAQGATASVPIRASRYHNPI